MVIGNAGMAICAVLASLEPKAALLPMIKESLDSLECQGLPPTLKFHSGWKKWRYPIGGQDHKFLSKEDALEVHEWKVKEMESLSYMTCKTMQGELKEASLKAPAKKYDAAEALLRLRYRKGPLAGKCSCSI